MTQTSQIPCIFYRELIKANAGLKPMQEEKGKKMQETGGETSQQKKTRTAGTPQSGRVAQLVWLNG